MEEWCWLLGLSKVKTCIRQIQHQFRVQWHFENWNLLPGFLVPMGDLKVLCTMSVPWFIDPLVLSPLGRCCPLSARALPKVKCSHLLRNNPSIFFTYGANHKANMLLTYYHRHAILCESEIQIVKKYIRGYYLQGEWTPPKERATGCLWVPLAILTCPRVDTFWS